VRKLQRKRGARKALLKNLATSLILYERIETTLEKAKETRSLVERLIQKGKKNDLASFRYLLRFLPKNAAKKVIEDLAPSFVSRNGGYVRIIKLRKRIGDNANLAIIEFTERTAVKKEEPKEQKPAAKVKKIAKKENKDEKNNKSKS